MLDLPLARSTRLLVEELDGELMVYDQDSDTAHVLSDSVARVWQLCDGRADVARIARDLEVDPAVVRQALQELEGCRLLASAPLAAPGFSRRDTFRKAAKVGAAVASAPLIYSLAIAPSAAMATAVGCATVSCGGTGVNSGSQSNNMCRTGGAVAAGCTANSTCNNAPLSGGNSTVGTCVFVP